MTHEEFETIAALAALGAATPEEASALEAHVQSCPQCRNASDEYAEAATLMARDIDPVAPPPSMRDEIVGSIRDGEEVVEIATRRRGTTWWLATAATLFLALWGWREIAIRVAREKVSAQQAEIRHLSEENRLLKQQKEKLSEDMQALASPETQMISLTGQTMAPAASAKVFMQSKDHRAVIFFYNLPPSPPDKSYQLWVIRGDQPKPVSGGVFEAANGSATMTVEDLPPMPNLKAFAVTMEPRGGVSQPTNANYVVMGTT